MNTRIAAGLLLLVVGLGTARAARAEVVQYGAGQKTCAQFVAAKERQPRDEIEVLDWLAGYVTGANWVSQRINNVLGDTNLAGAASWLGTFCRTHPTTLVYVATDVLVVKSRLSTARRTVDLIAYGQGYKSCAAYDQARQQPSADEDSFLSWLAGFVSGVNAVAPGINNVLRDGDLTASIVWLDAYCQAHPGSRFAAAVSDRLIAADARVVQANSRW